jgi:hypothetical protein
MIIIWLFFQKLHYLQPWKQKSFAFCEYCWQHAKDNDKIFWQLKSFVLKKLVTHQKNRGEKLVTTMLCGCTLCGECPCNKRGRAKIQTIGVYFRSWKQIGHHK